MAITVRTTATGSDATTSATFTAVTDSSPQVGDVLIIFHSNDFYALSNMSAPTVTGSPTVTAVTNGAADAGANVGHIKAWWAVVNTAGANTVTYSETGTHDEEKGGAVWVLSGADTTNPIDAANNSFNTTGATSQTTPTVSPTGTDSLLIGHISTINAVTATSYTPPGSMTEKYDFTVGGLMTVTGANEQLSASGATGTRTFTAASSSPWAAVSVAVKTASAAAVAGPYTGPAPGRVSPTGEWSVVLGDATTPLNVYVPAAAAATGVAYDATVDVDPAADQTAGTGTGYDATPDVQVNADQTAATGTAFDATVSVDYGNNAGPWMGPTPGYLGPTGRLTALVGDATTPLNVYAPDVSTGTGTGFDATVDAGIPADQTAATGTAFDATPDVQVNADQTAGTGTAYDATVITTTGDLYAGPWAAPTPGYLGPTGRLSALVGDATVTPAGVANADQTSAAGTAYDATVDVGLAADVANATGAAFDDVAALAAAVENALAAGTALDAAVRFTAAADAAAGTATAFDATVTVDYLVAGPWTHPTPGRISPTGEWTVQAASGGVAAERSCVTRRPTAGVTSRSSSGTTARPFTGITEEPC